jgi:positive regulator of sigma E activity
MRNVAELARTGLVRPVNINVEQYIMGKLKDTYWPDIITTAIAEKCVKNAAGVAYFVAGITALLALLAWFDVFHLLSPWSLLDAALFAVIAFLISRGQERQPLPASFSTDRSS